jgi:hypothetical protein
MENPHAERQAILLERILKNAVSALIRYFSRGSHYTVSVHGDDT